jgi:hypothetical protein
MSDAAIPFEELANVINEGVNSVKAKIDAIKQKGDQLSIGEMFEMQMLMNHLSQMSEMSTQVVSASNQAIISMARNVKG